MNPHFQRGLLLFQQSRWQMAEEEIRRGLADEPQDSWAHTLLALSLKEQKKLDAALAEAQQGIGLGPEAAFAHYGHAKVLVDLGRLKLAQQAIEEAIRLDPREADYHAAEGWIYVRMSLWGFALGCAETALGCEAGHVDALNLRATSLRMLGRKEEALGASAGSLERDPENSRSHAVQGRNYLEHGEPKKALAHFREALRLDPNFEYARQGLVDALKAANFFYRWVLRYFLWMAVLSAPAKWGVLIGVVAAMVLISAAFPDSPAMPVALVLLLALYIASFYISWVAEPLSNLLLRFNRFGRYALSEDEARQSNWFGAFFLAGILGFAAALVTGDGRASVFAVWAGSMTVPATLAFSPANREGWLLPTVALSLAAVGLGAVIAACVQGIEGGAYTPLFALYVVAWIAFTVLGTRGWFRKG